MPATVTPLRSYRQERALVREIGRLPPAIRRQIFTIGEALIVATPTEDAALKHAIQAGPDNLDVILALAEQILAAHAPDPGAA